MKSKLKNLLCIALVCITIFGTACTKKEAAPIKSADNKPTSTIENTDKIKESEGTPTSSATPESTAKPTATNNNTPSATPKTEKPTTKPTTTTAAPTATKKPTVTTAAPTATKKPTVTTTVPTATKKPTVTTVAPTATPKPIDTNKYTVNCGPILSSSDFTEFALKNTGEVYKVPSGMKSIDNWIIEMYDKENEQFFIKVIRSIDEPIVLSNADFYAFVKGEFYKVSEGNIVSMSQETEKNIIRWVEDNGLGKSINVRSKWYNEVYIEVEGAFEVGAGEFVNSLGNAIVPKSENVKANVVKLS